jgi:hypothetical protein
MARQERPGDSERTRLPIAMDSRLRELLDRQDLEGTLSWQERAEAEWLTDLVDLVTLTQLRRICLQNERETMGKTVHESPLERLLEPFVTQCFTHDVAMQVMAFRADAATQRRIDDLAEKCNEGELTESEQLEYEGYVEAINLISILQAKARSFVGDQETI